MKKITAICGFLAFVIAGVNADLSVSFVNNTTAVGMPGIVEGDGDLSHYIPEPSIVQLIWSPVNNTASRLSNTEVDVGGTLKAGEVLLLQTTTAPPNPWGYGSWNPTSGVWNDAFVGGVDINTGYFYARVFTGDALGDSYYYETAGIDASGWDYDPNDPQNQPVYNDSMLKDETAFIAVDANNTTVIPEPGTFGLMGLAGLGLFMARRSALKKARRI